MDTVKICDLPITDHQKMCLSLLSKPRNVYEVAARTHKSFSYTNQNLNMLAALGYAKKLKKLNGGVLWTLSDKVKM